MAAGTAVLASDIPAFRRVLGEGAYGTGFRNEDAADLERKVVTLLRTTWPAGRCARPRPRRYAATTGRPSRAGSCRSTRP